MKRILKYTLLLAGVIAAAAMVSTRQQEPGKGIFYRVSGGKSEMYLLGSIHVGNEDMYPMAENIQNAIRKADTVVFECDTDSDEASKITAESMMSDAPLSAVISDSLYEQLEQAAKRTGYSMAAFEKMKPWAVTSVLTLEAASQGLNAVSREKASAFGVEKMVREMLDGQKILYLEKTSEQLERMDSFSPELQEYLLLGACGDVLETKTSSSMEQDMEQWPKWWHDGDAQAFADSFKRSMEKETALELAQEYQRALLTERNLMMAGRLQELLESEDTGKCVVTVGLMHLVLPDDSIVSLLREKGYQVERLTE